MPSCTCQLAQVWRRSCQRKFERNQGQFPRQGHDADAARAQAPAREARPIPLAERTAWLEAQPQPGDLDDHRPYPSVASFADALITLGFATVVGRAYQAGEGGELTPVAKCSPAEEFHHQEPGARRAGDRGTWCSSCGAAWAPRALAAEGRSAKAESREPASEDLSAREELYKMASDLGISGRSKMSKEQLIDAVQGERQAA